MRDTIKTNVNVTNFITAHLYGLLLVQSSEQFSDYEPKVQLRQRHSVAADHFYNQLIFTMGFDLWCKTH